MKKKIYSMAEGIRLKCNYNICGHEWTYHGNSRFYTSCPICKSQVSVKKALIAQGMEWE